MLDKTAFLLSTKCVPDDDFGNVELASKLVNSEEAGKPRPICD
jgi:hypothetical protein